MKKGFTLIEVLAVVSLLALLALLVGPKVLEQRDKKNKEISEATKKVIYSDASEYIMENLEKYDVKAGNVFCIRIEKLIEEDKISMDAEDFKNKIIRVAVDSNDNFMYSLVEKCNEIK